MRPSRAVLISSTSFPEKIIFYNHSDSDEKNYHYRYNLNRIKIKKMQ